jgi:MFS transporter, DHA2 family, multidrug resistance protein
MTSTKAFHLVRKISRKDELSRIVHNSHRYRWWLLGNVMIGTFMAVLDSTIVNVGLPKIMASFGVGIDKIEWVITAYMLALAVMLPTAGWFADRFGYKRIYFGGLFIFTLGSFLCGLSTDENLLIFSRIVQGLGAGTIMPLGMAIISREFPPEKRGIALGFWSIAAAASVSFGPLIGGYLVDNFNWQLIFDVNIPVGIIGMFVTFIIQKEYRNKNVRHFDLIGFISVSIFLPVTLYALSEGNASTNSAGWSAPYIIVCFIIAVICLAVFITTELIVEHPLIDLRLFGHYNFGMATIVLFIFGIGMFGSTFLLPLYLQNCLNYTAVQSGAVFLPVGIIQGILSPVIGMTSNKISPKVPIITGLLLLTISFYINYNMTYLTEHTNIMLSLYIRGFGMGMIFTPLSTISLSDIPRDKMAQASGLFNVVRQLGGSFGVAILATILSTRVTYHTQMYGEALQPYSPEYKRISTGLVTNAMHNAGSSLSTANLQSRTILVSHLTKQSYIKGINDDFLIAAGITLTGIIPVSLLRSKNKKTKEQKKKE